MCEREECRQVTQVGRGKKCTEKKKKGKQKSSNPEHSVFRKNRTKKGKKHPRKICHRNIITLLKPTADDVTFPYNFSLVQMENFSLKILPQMNKGQKKKKKVV